MSESRVGIEQFGPVADFYDRLMSTVPYRMWVGYYLLLLSTIDSKPKRTLDVCCGTGAMAFLLEDEGMRVEGFDLSASMIEAAREKASQLLRTTRFEVQDARSFDMGKTYDGAFCFFDSLNYIVDDGGLESALKRVFAHLEPGAAFIFDMNTAYAFEQKMFDQKKLDKRAKVRYQWFGNYDPATRIIHVDMSFWVDGEERHETHVQRAYSDDEIREALERVGFVGVTVYHSYTLDKPRRTSDRVHFVAVRPA